MVGRKLDDNEGICVGKIVSAKLTKKTLKIGVAVQKKYPVSKLKIIMKAHVRNG